ncbi:hypothetical protein [Methylomicrobium lacus]|uniref:hypothetical protein n=1 Tax=Methylomicrobium lacus TaxID=136992 RepID=UPI0035A8FA6F
MNSFKKFIDKAKESPTKTLPASDISLSTIQTSLASVVDGVLTPFSAPSDKKQKFSEEVSNLVQDNSFISDFSDRIGEPSEFETEDEFVDRSKNILRKMLYAKFGISS